MCPENTFSGMPHGEVYSFVLLFLLQTAILLNVGQLTDTTKECVIMQRMSRAGRKQSVISAITMLKRGKVYSVFTKGEICKKMGLKSNTHMRDLLHEMVKDGWLISCMGSLPNYAHDIEMFGIAVYRQAELPNHSIKINGKVWDS